MPYFYVPQPLEECPSLSIWRSHEGKEFRVFIDESFFEFFDFSRTDGNFCYGAFGIPSDQYDAFSNALRPALTSVLARTGLGEFKHAKFSSLDCVAKREFTLALDASLKQHGGFLTGFFSTNHGYVMRRIRESLLASDCTSIPEDHAGLVGQCIQSLNDDLRNVDGSARLLADLIKEPVSCITGFLGAFKCMFDVDYDPRQSREDSGVASGASEMIAAIERLHGVIDFGPGCQEFRSRAKSETEVGLQIADFTAGEVRRFFRFNPELLTFGSGRRLVTPESDDPLESALLIGGQLVKDGRFTRIPDRIIRQYHRPSPDVQLPLVMEMLASGSLVCTAEYGETRVVRLFQHWLFDMCD